VTVSIFSLNLADHKADSMSQIFLRHQAKLPLCLTLNELTLCAENKANLEVKEPVELIVFESLTLAQLSQLSQACSITLQTLTTINTRLGKTTYRFNISCEHLHSARTSLTQFCHEQQIEAAIIKEAPLLNQPGLLVMDMDSTTIEIECIDEIAALAGVGEQVAEVTERAMLGELDFSESLHQRVGTLANASQDILADVASNLPLMAGLETLVSELKQHQWRIAIASGGFTYFADHLKKKLSLDAAFANTLEIQNGKLTGKVLGDIIDAQAKADVLNELATIYAISTQQTVAMGDGANDLVMMEAAQLGVAFKAKPIVQKQADSALNLSGLDGMIHWLA